MASAEVAISKLNNKDKYYIRTGIFKILLKKNVSVSPDFNSELNMLKNLTKDPSVVVTRTDKGRVTVILDKY